MPHPITCALVASLVACLPSVSTSQAPTQRPSSAPAPLLEDERLADSLASLAPMLGGEWRVAFANGTKQFDRWSPGPGGHSIASQTFGTDAAGNPWRVLSVYYWHPGRRQVRVLSLHPDVPGVGRGLAEGIVQTGREDLSVLLEMRQSGRGDRTRKLETRTLFDGPDRYRATLLEDAGTGFAPIAEWEYLRSRELSSKPVVAAAAITPSERFRAFEPLLAQTWEAEGVSMQGTPFRVQTTFEWVPYIEVVVARAALVAASGERTPLLEAYILRDVRSETSRVLALTSAGAVLEGGLTCLDGGALEFDLTEATREGQDSDVRASDPSARRQVRVDVEQGGTVRTRLWSGRENDRELLFDVQHRKIETPMR